MNTPWIERLLERLQKSVNQDGGWGYQPRAVSSAEPTAFACLSLINLKTPTVQWLPGLKWLASIQRSDGSVPVQANLATPGWPTPLAILAWIASESHTNHAYEKSIASATTWLLATKGKTIFPIPKILSHDTTLQGWPWVAGTHSWVEPTAYAILALRAVGLRNHQRTREGIRLLYDRVLPDGGWNYGNKRVLKKTLEAISAPTAIALTALTGESRNESIDHSISYISRKLTELNVPLSLAWIVIGLTAWKQRPRSADRRLMDCADRWSSQSSLPLEDALLLLAASDTISLTDPQTGTKSHG